MWARLDRSSDRPLVKATSKTGSIGRHEPRPSSHFLGFALDIFRRRRQLARNAVVAKWSPAILHQENSDLFLQDDAHVRHFRGRSLTLGMSPSSLNSIPPAAKAAWMATISAGLAANSPLSIF